MQNAAFTLVMLPPHNEVRRAWAARIAEELNSQYVMAYASPHATDGKYHRIRVRVDRPGYKVRARNGYVGTAKPGSQRP